jgi:RsiW-degrading membrane proteinase PrsW (M82 family)
MIIMKISATITLIAVVALFLTTNLIKRRGDLWDKASFVVLGTIISGVFCSLLALIWGV